jgi:apolipoprotein N-acyltransferase
MKKYLLVALSIAGGILSSFAWSGWCSGLILLVSFVPFLLIENYLYENRDRYSPNAYFTYILPGFLMFSLLTLGWIRVASIVAAICVITGITFIMSFILWLAHIVRLRAGNLFFIIATVSFWLGYEYLSLNSNILSPWINLGNGLAKDIIFIQWYEVTGTSGGSLWILLSNIFLTIFLTKSLAGCKRNRLYLFTWLLIIAIPL